MDNRDMIWAALCEPMSAAELEQKRKGGLTNREKMQALDAEVKLMEARMRPSAHEPAAKIARYEEKLRDRLSAGDPNAWILLLTSASPKIRPQAGEYYSISAPAADRQSHEGSE